MKRDQQRFSTTSGFLLAVVAALVMGCGTRPDAASERGAPDGSELAERTSGPSRSGPELYTEHCAACHGANGDGGGPAAVFLFPRPRDFRAGRWRLTSTVNGIPAREDIEAVLMRGMPGSAMVSWAHVPAADRRALAEHVLQLRREGARDIELKMAAEVEEELSEEQLAEAISQATTPGDLFEPPPIGPSSSESVARGKEVYLAKGCAGCHGDTGKGDGQQKMVDSEGLPTRPRDLTLGIFKGNHDPQSVYRRIWLGMPGSPMPASQQLTPQEVTDMVHFVLSLSSEEQREAAVLKRGELTATRTQTLPAGPEDSGWSGAKPAVLRTTPLWWRDAFADEVTVEAMHDGKTLALRLSWNDPTHDAAATRPDQFEDMVALELTAGPREPFLGMGAADAPAIEVWQWRAGTRATGAEDELSDDYPFDTAVYREHSGGKPLPDFVTARVVGNPLATRAHDGASLAAKGFGTLTFLPKTSQVVSAEGTWNDGRWTVTLRRPLVVTSDEGLTLGAPARYSVAFAVWDGSARDRGPQKLITLWNELRVE